ncbi:Uncharacterized protein C9orf75-like [Cricetulus griseus]|uniref:Uncharacterized protein C9orf75-like n=1 Tax=Cricetulus griseus TaxID=10029 RepID=G3IG39_CRIGR|nr:Uncharacterized protein C9orf75-like [Cricetulus griseus]
MAGLGRPGPGPRTAMPAWKREILERRRAKLAALSGGPGQGAAPEGQDEKLVLAESLGPLSENPPRHTSELPNRGSNTFIVVPKRKPETLQVPHFSQANGQSQQQEAEEQDADSLSGPHTALENTLKKRYPTVHEIEVIGGYLALQKSCLIKAGSSRKKMKISFNDNSLYTTFEYPSESSLEQEEAEDEEEGEKDGEGEEVDSEKPFSVFLPRATFVSSVGPEIPRLPDGSSGLSSYTPKHSMAFSKWQEQTVVQAPSEVELPPKEVMLTPASQNDLSDFRSEPALYF